MLIEEAKPGTACSDIYSRALDKVGKFGFAADFYRKTDHRVRGDSRFESNVKSGEKKGLAIEF